MSRRSAARRTLLAILVSAALASAALLAGVNGAAALAGSSVTAKGPYGIPPIADTNPLTGNPVPYAGSADAAARSSKAKIDVRLPPVTVSAYASFCAAFTIGDGTYGETCCPDPTTTPCEKVDPPSSSVDLTESITWTQVRGPTWVNSPKGVTPAFGTFATVPVRALAFGSLPVTAKITLQQTVGANGYYRPLDFYLAFSSAYPIGATVDGFGTTPASPFAPSLGSYAYRPARLNGTVDVRISDVTVDGRAVDVGTGCHTANPAKLTLGAPGGFVGVGNDDTGPEDYRGRPGSFGTAPGSQLYGNIDIGRFTGCGTSRDDLSPLLTGLVSSSRNPVVTTLRTTLDVCNYPGCPAIPTSTGAGFDAIAAAAKPRTSR